MIREAIRAAIVSQNLRQVDVAERAKMTQPNLSAYLNGHNEINTDTADRLCAVLGLFLTSKAPLTKG